MIDEPHRAMNLAELTILARQWTDRQMQLLFHKTISVDHFNAEMWRILIKFSHAEKAQIQAHIEAGEFEAARKIINDMFDVEYGNNEDRSEADE